MNRKEILLALESGGSKPSAIAHGMSIRIAGEFGYDAGSDVQKAARRAALEMYAAIIEETWKL